MPPKTHHSISKPLSLILNCTNTSESMTDGGSIWPVNRECDHLQLKKKNSQHFIILAGEKLHRRLYGTSLLMRKLKHWIMQMCTYSKTTDSSFITFGLVLYFNKHKCITQTSFWAAAQEKYADENGACESVNCGQGSKKDRNLNVSTQLPPLPRLPIMTERWKFKQHLIN